MHGSLSTACNLWSRLNSAGGLLPTNTGSDFSGDGEMFCEGDRERERNAVNDLVTLRKNCDSLLGDFSRKGGFPKADV